MEAKPLSLVIPEKCAGVDVSMMVTTTGAFITLELTNTVSSAPSADGEPARMAVQKPVLCPVLATDGAAPSVVLGAVGSCVLARVIDEAPEAALATVVVATDAARSERTAAEVGVEATAAPATVDDGDGEGDGGVGAVVAW